ncbi:MAG: hypothetical protein IH588_01580 [Anaerolineales bacterium]|nr:hypothetical protein [Anaerolineales bacterium]
MIPDLNNRAEVANYIRRDSTARLWDFSASGLEYQKRDFDFGIEDFKISVIDQFSGRVPAVMSKETLLGNYPPALAPTVILDSNVMAYLHQFVTARESQDEKQRKAVIQLLDYLLHTKFDYNPSFYYLESFSKSAESSQKIIEYTKSILSLHMMDELHFLQKREICVDKGTLTKYAEKFDTYDVDEMAKRQCEILQNMHVPSTDWKVLYLIILKAALIHRTFRGDFEAKLRKLYEFVYEIFGVLFSRELGVASFYFSGELDKFIPLQKNANAQDTIKRIKSTAWDMYLLRLPELMLCHEDAPIPLAMICTGDKGVQSVGRKFRVRKLFTAQGVPFPELEIRFDGERNNELRSKLFEEFSRNRKEKRRDLDVDQVLNGLDMQIELLENEIFEFCNFK